MKKKGQRSKLKKSERKQKNVSKNTVAREASENPGLNKSYHPKNRWEYIDYDYVDKLSPEEAEWLSKFNDEYMSGSFKHKGKKLHKTKKEQRECYTRNNARNRDQFALLKSNNLLSDSTEMYKVVTECPEDTLIEMLDLDDGSTDEKK